MIQLVSSLSSRVQFWFQIEADIHITGQCEIFTEPTGCISWRARDVLTSLSVYGKMVKKWMTAASPVLVVSLPATSFTMPTVLIARWAKWAGSTEWAAKARRNMLCCSISASPLTLPVSVDLSTSLISLSTNCQSGPIGVGTFNAKKTLRMCVHKPGLQTCSRRHYRMNGKNFEEAFVIAGVECAKAFVHLLELA